MGAEDAGVRRQAGSTLGEKGARNSRFVLAANVRE